MLSISLFQEKISNEHKLVRVKLEFKTRQSLISVSQIRCITQHVVILIDLILGVAYLISHSSDQKNNIF
jgi:hypothetical protein